MFIPFVGVLDLVQVRLEHPACCLDELSILPKFEENPPTRFGLLNFTLS